MCKSHLHHSYVCIRCLFTYWRSSCIWSCTVIFWFKFEWNAVNAVSETSRWRAIWEHMTKMRITLSSKMKKIISKKIVWKFLISKWVHALQSNELSARLQIKIIHSTQNKLWSHMTITSNIDLHDRLSLKKKRDLYLPHILRQIYSQF